MAAIAPFLSGEPGSRHGEKERERERERVVKAESVSKGEILWHHSIFFFS